VIRLPADSALRKAMHKIAPQVSLIIATIMIYIFATHKGLRFGDRVMHTNGFSLLAFGFGGLLVICLPFHAPSIVRMLFLAAPMRFLGKYSYGLYVLHYLMLPHLPPSPYVGLTVWEVVNVGIYFLVCLMLFIAAAWLSWHLLEQPFLSLKRCWHYGAKQSYPEIQAQGGGRGWRDIGLTERTVGPIATARRHSEPE
jgi:peptidoglycan/LPS O-acetylase OafA/YrhL